MLMAVTIHRNYCQYCILLQYSYYVDTFSKDNMSGRIKGCTGNDGTQQCNYHNIKCFNVLINTANSVSIY